MGSPVYCLLGERMPDVCLGVNSIRQVCSLDLKHRNVLL